MIGHSIRAGLFMLALSGAAQAAGPVDPEWPCIQRLVPHLSLGQVWAGPQPDEAMVALSETPQVQELARAISLRRTPLEQAESLIATYAGTSDAAGLTALYLAAFDQINASRDRVLTGISRYARKQANLDATIKEKRHEFARLNAADALDFDALDAVERDIDWSTRIFLDRQQSLTYVCETPVILEQRAFALGRAVMNHMP